MRALVAGLALSLLSGAASGQTDTPVLQGPKVVERERPATLVQREMGGALVRLEVRPEEAAIDLLGLTPEQKAATAKVLQERSAQVSRALADHYDLFLKIAAARQGGAPRGELAPLARQFRDETPALFEPPLAERVQGALPEEKRERFRALVDEYKKAVLEDEAPKRDDTEPVGERRATARLEISLTLRELGRALRASVQERRERTDDLIKTLDATQEQEEKIRAIIREVGGQQGVIRELGPEKRREMMERILAELSPEQRRAALERLRPR
jgi:hypothetical protein